ncbi:ABC transporter permease [Nonomuraea sp. NPDC050310]|uniref:ABC transporter permease n=1 Tax=unclassified Nonomuraea TaxID=2593643 RepID=UPI0033DF5949
MRAPSWTENKVVCGVLGVVGVTLLAELAGRTGLISTDLFPLASTIIAEAITLIADPAFLGDIAGTFGAWAAGLALTVLLAVPAGLVLGSVPALEAVARPVIEFLRPIPSIAIIPLAVFLFPDNLQMKIGVIAYASTWPILINTIYGVKDVDPLAKETLRTFGFGRSAVLARVSLPSAAPFIATGIRIAAGFGLIVAISAELISSQESGIGTFILEAGSSPEGVLLTVAAVLWAGVLGLLTNAAFVGAERRMFRWHTAKTGGAR